MDLQVVAFNTSGQLRLVRANITAGCINRYTNTCFLAHNFRWFRINFDRFQFVNLFLANTVVFSHNLTNDAANLQTLRSKVSRVSHGQPMTITYSALTTAKTYFLMIKVQTFGSHHRLESTYLFIFHNFL